MTDAAAEMDSIYRVQRHIYDASRKFYLLGRDGMLDSTRSAARWHCSRNRLRHRAQPHCGVGPLSGGAVLRDRRVGRHARRRRMRLSRRLAFHIAFALRGPMRVSLDTVAAFGIAEFDRVFVSYALSMIPPWREALEQAYAVVKPGGSLHIVDFGEQERLPGLFRAGLRAWLKRFSVEPRAELEAEVLKLADAHGARATFERPFRDYACSAVIRKPAKSTQAEPLRSSLRNKLCDQDSRQDQRRRPDQRGDRADGEERRCRASQYTHFERHQPTIETLELAEQQAHQSAAFDKRGGVGMLLRRRAERPHLEAVAPAAAALHVGIDVAGECARCGRQPDQSDVDLAENHQRRQAEGEDQSRHEQDGAGN